MKVEDIAKLEKAKELLELIDSYKSCIEELEKFLSANLPIEGGTLYSEGENKIRLRLSEELTMKVMNKVLEEYKEILARLEKEFGDYWYNCNEHQLKVIADEILHWDGYITKTRKSFSTTSKKNADFVQFVFSPTSLMHMQLLYKFFLHLLGPHIQLFLFVLWLNFLRQNM